MNEKAYKLLAVQENISNAQAKKLIDDGHVFLGEKKVTIARAEIPATSTLRVDKPKPPKIIFEDADLMAINKPRGEESYDLEKRFGQKLIHRLDKQTSGVLLFAKNDEFLAQAIAAFKKGEVVKKYLAVVEGIVAETLDIDLPVFTEKGSKAKSTVDKKRGLPAHTIARPVQVEGKKTMLEVEIPTGRTHQIRVHLSHAGFPILGDEQYGARPFKRLMLHASYISLLGREISAPTPPEFNMIFSRG